MHSGRPSGDATSSTAQSAAVGHASAFIVGVHSCRVAALLHGLQVLQHGLGVRDSTCLTRMRRGAIEEAQPAVIRQPQAKPRQRREHKLV